MSVSVCVCVCVCVMSHDVWITHYRFQPSEEDREMYKNYKESKDKLQNEDQFLMKVSMFAMLFICCV